jgi:hypothetical protein
MIENGAALLGIVGFLYLSMCTVVGFCIIFPWGWTGVYIIIIKRKQISAAVQKEIEESRE